MGQGVRTGWWGSRNLSISHKAPVFVWTGYPLFRRRDRGIFPTRHPFFLSASTAERTAEPIAEPTAEPTAESTAESTAE